MRTPFAFRLAVSVTVAIGAWPASAQIPQDEYLRYLPLSYPSMVRETVATQRFRLYGDQTDPSYRDEDPKDGVDDARARWLHALGVRFAPLMVRNSATFPLDFRHFYSQPSFAIHVDTWDLARDKASFVEGTRIDVSALAGHPCPGPDATEGDDCRLLALIREFGPRRGPIEPEVAGHAEQQRFTVMYFDFPGHDEKTWKEQHWPRRGETKRKELAGTERMFVHPFIAEARPEDSGANGFELVLQYWSFYPVNDGPNNHEGDWEHINVVVSPKSRVERPLEAGEMERLLGGSADFDGDDPLVIRRVEYYFHHFVFPVDFSSPNAYLPREAWQRQVAERATGTYGERWLWERIRERAWQDAAETKINTRPVVWIGGDAIGVQSAIEMPGLKDQDGHASYPFRGYYKKIGAAGVGERVVRAFELRQFFERPASVPKYVEDYASPDRVVLLPDWERLVDPVLTDAEVRRAWAWHLLPLRFGFPATPSPAGGVVAHVDTGNSSPIGPAFNSAWNRIGNASGYELYDVVKLSWATPLGVPDSFFPRAGFLNAPILYFMLKSPLDLAWRTLALPVRAAVGTRQPTFFPANVPPERLVSIEVGAMVTPVSEDFTALFFNREQLPEILIRSMLELLPSDTSDISTVPVFPTAVAPAYSLAFHLGRRFSTESSLTSYRSTIGFDIVPLSGKPVEVRGRFEQFDFHGNLRFNLLTGNIKPYVKYGSGITWYQLRNVRVAGEELLVPTSPKFKPRGSWSNFGFNELILGGGLDVSSLRVGKLWLGGKVSYTLIHHPIGFEKEFAVELTPEFAKLVAGTTYSVWRHQLRVMGTVGF